MTSWDENGLVFNIDNDNNDKLSTKSAYYNDFWWINIGVMMLKIQLCHHRNKLHSKMYSNRKSLFKIAMFHVISVLLYFFILLKGEHKRLYFQKHEKKRKNLIDLFLIVNIKINTFYLFIFCIFMRQITAIAKDFY